MKILQYPPTYDASLFTSRPSLLATKFGNLKIVRNRLIYLQYVVDRCKFYLVRRIIFLINGVLLVLFFLLLVYISETNTFHLGNMSSY